MLVYVLNTHGKPLMPCRPRKARILLQENKAKVVDVEPLTIQLIYGSSGYKQAVALGVDIGYEKVGLSVISGMKELYRSEVEIRTEIPQLLTEKRMFRRNRRYRKTRYRKLRNLNREASTREGRLPPSVQHKLDSHVKLVERIKKKLPVTRTLVEKAQFDIARINNPDWKGKDFQRGAQYGYANTKAYVRDRDGYRCRNCGDNKKKLVVHHIRPREEGGSDRPDNLVILCDVCHEGHHKAGLELELKNAPVQKRMSTMNILSYRLSELYDTTFGYVTMMRRLEQGLEKSHINDAFVIAGGTENTERLDCTIIQKQVRKNNRKLFKGRRSEISNKCEKELFGFRLFDKVLYNSKKYFVWGRRKSGSFLLKNLTGAKINRNYKKLKRFKGQTSFLTELQFPPA